MSAFGGGLKRSTQHFISDASDGVDGRWAEDMFEGSTRWPRRSCGTAGGAVLLVCPPQILLARRKQQGRRRLSNDFIRACKQVWTDRAGSQGLPSRTNSDRCLERMSALPP